MMMLMIMLCFIAATLATDREAAFLAAGSGSGVYTELYELLSFLLCYPLGGIRTQIE